MADGRHIEKTENRNNSANIWDIVTKFGTLVEMGSPQRVVMSPLTCNKIRDGGRPPFWKKENVHNSAAIWVIFPKFGLLMAMDSAQRPRHIEKRKIAKLMWNLLIKQQVLNVKKLTSLQHLVRATDSHIQNSKNHFTGPSWYNELIWQSVRSINSA